MDNKNFTLPVEIVINTQPIQEYVQYVPWSVQWRSSKDIGGVLSQIADSVTTNHGWGMGVGDFLAAIRDSLAVAEEMAKIGSHELQIGWQ